MNHTKLRNIKPGMDNLSLVVKVLSIEEPRIVVTRFGEAKVASALVEDETGRLRLKLWRAQIDIVKPGDLIKIENGFAVEFGNVTEINIGSKGRITVIEGKTQSR